MPETILSYVEARAIKLRGLISAVEGLRDFIHDKMRELCDIKDYERAMLWHKTLNETCRMLCALRKELAATRETVALLVAFSTQELECTAS